MTNEAAPKVLCGLEHLIVQGEPLHANATSPIAFSPRCCHLRKLAPHIQKRLAGNAFEFSSFGYFALYVLSNLSLKKPELIDLTAEPEEPV